MEARKAAPKEKIAVTIYAARKKPKKVVPSKQWKNKSGTLFGWIELPARGGENLILSLHSSVALARENIGRIITDEIRRYLV